MCYYSYIQQLQHFTLLLHSSVLQLSIGQLQVLKKVLQLCNVLLCMAHWTAALSSIAKFISSNAEVRAAVLNLFAAVNGSRI
jgi:hypothetical protein